MIRQLRSPTFFVTFIASINNWSIIIETFKLLYNNNYNKTIEISNNIQNIKKLIRNDPITCAYYYEHTMNTFQKLFKNTNMIFGNIIYLFCN